MTDKEIYIHIPFCQRKCNYCDFLSFPAEESCQTDYMEALYSEIEQESQGGCVSTVFIGGGTPSLLSEKEIERLMEVLHKKYNIRKNAEITIEANPGTIHKKKLLVYKKAGINRLSLGLQSADNRELQLLGRIHTWEMFLENYHLSREAGFENINVDLMSALPGQTREGWRKTLQKVVAIHPEHISAYSLILEEGTPFYDQYAVAEEARKRGEECAELPAEEEERGMYEDTEKLLKKVGYDRYEISNYAKKGYECRHNCGYWERVNYRGFGLGASSLMDEIRFRNTECMEEYLKGDFPRKDEEVLSRHAQMEEFMFLGLRLKKGISKNKFEKTFQCSFKEIYGNIICRLEQEALIEQKGDSIYLSSRGRDLSNYVLTEFLLDAEDSE